MASKNTGLLDLPSNAKWSQKGVTVAGGNGKGGAANQLGEPFGLTVDGQDGTMYVADWYNHCVMAWKPGDKEGRVVAGGQGQGNGLHQLNSPTDVALDKQSESIFICDHKNQRVVRWSLQNGTTQGETIIDNVKCVGLVVDNNGALYVTDIAKDEVRQYPKGQGISIVVAGGHGKGWHLHQLNCPYYVAVDDEGAVYVSEWKNHRVVKWVKGAPEGIVVAGGGRPGVARTQLHRPEAIVIDAKGAVYVADGQNNRVMRWCKGAHEGDIIVGGNVEGGSSDQLNHPMGLSFDHQGYLYVADTGNSRVQRFALE